MSRLIEFVSDPDKNPRFRQKLKVFFGFTEDLASLSTCRRLQVGALIVQPDFSEVLAVGYNGPPAGRSNDSCRSNQGNCGCVHAEANAIAKLATRDRDLLMLVTASPCEACAGLIINSGRVAVLIYGEPYRDPTGLTLLEGSLIVRRISDL